MEWPNTGCTRRSPVDTQGPQVPGVNVYTAAAAVVMSYSRTKRYPLITQTTVVISIGKSWSDGLPFTPTNLKYESIFLPIQPFQQFLPLLPHHDTRIRIHPPWSHIRHSPRDSVYIMDRKYYQLSSINTCSIHLIAQETAFVQNNENPVNYHNIVRRHKRAFVVVSYLWG